MKRLLPVLLLLAACGTPQEQCISLGTRDLQVLDRLIRETEGNISRGYAYAEQTVYVPMWLDCTPRPTEAVPAPAPEMCLEEVPRTTRKAVAIDLAAEKAKLAGMKAKRAELARAAQPVIAQCKAKYPE